MNAFTKDAGRILSPTETQTMTDAYRERKVNEAKLKPDEYVRSEFFGLDHIKHLIDHPDCVGLRIHHAKRWEDVNGKPTAKDKGQLVPRVLLTGVDAQGRDLPVYTDKAGMKDDNGGGGSVGDGFTCPQHCPTNT
ncbi:hypothetical protein BH09BAC4_BH09BAC4_25740 [soil metagenome]